MFGPVDSDVSKHRTGFKLRFKQSKQLLAMVSPQSVGNLSLSDVAARPSLLYFCFSLLIYPL